MNEVNCQCGRGQPPHSGPASLHTVGSIAAFSFRKYSCRSFRTYFKATEKYTFITSQMREQCKEFPVTLPVLRVTEHTLCIHFCSLFHPVQWQSWLPLNVKTQPPSTTMWLILPREQSPYVPTCHPRAKFSGVNPPPTISTSNLHHPLLPVTIIWATWL